MLANPYGGKILKGYQRVAGPSFGIRVDLLATDNVGMTASNRQSDFITSVLPSLYVNADTARLRGTLNYAPVAQFYANTPDQDRFDQRFFGNMLATLVEDAFFLDLRGASTISSVTGGLGAPLPVAAGQPQMSQVFSRQTSQQTTSLQASPYFLHRFGELASLRLGYNFQYTNLGTASSAATGLPSQDTTTNNLYAVTRTGEDFGRLALQSTLSATRYSANIGALNGAHRDTALLEARYALTGPSPPWLRAAMRTSAMAVLYHIRSRVASGLSVPA